MRNEALDVIMICKGCYNKDKYENVETALIEYYKKQYLMDMDNKDVSKNLLNITIMSKTVHWLMENAPDRMRGFVNTIFTMESYYDIPQMLPYTKEYDNAVSKMDFDELLFYKLVHFFKNLKMNGDCIAIDTSDYYTKHGDEPVRKIVME